MLYAYNFMHPATNLNGIGARKRLLEDSKTKISIDADFLDLVRTATPDQERRTAIYLREKYARNPPDLVMTIGGEALPFILKYRDIIAPDIPVVFSAVSRANYESSLPPPDVTGVIIDLNLEKTIELAERLQPEARRIYLIAGSAAIDRRWQTVARAVMASHRSKLEVHYLFELPYDELVAEVLRVPRDSIVVWLSVFIDGAGKPFVPGQVEVALANASPAPFYSTYSVNLGKGILGGYSETFDSHGAAAADIALEILNGRDPRTISPRTNPDQRYRVDYNAMQRWHLNESRLPPGTVITGRDPTIWEQHRDFVMVTVSIILLLAGFSGALLFQRRRRRAAELRSKESEERMAFTAQAVNAGLWQYDRAKDEVWATAHCRSLLGLGRHKPLTKDSFLSTIHPEDRDTATAVLEQAAEGQAVVRDIRVSLLAGDIRWLSIRVRSQTDPKDRADQLSGILVDISEQKASEAEASLQRQEVAHLTRVAVLGELSGAIAHEINQPLTAILSNAYAALDMVPIQSPEFDELRETLRDIIQEDNRAGEVIGRLRKLLKKGALNPEPINLNALVRSTVALLKSEMINRRINVVTNLLDTLPLTSGDPVQIQQVLLNLVMNGMDAMNRTPPSLRTITISSSLMAASAIKVEVRDRGSGIPATAEKRVFEPFYTTKDHGLGLGLAICQTIVHEHGGTLTLKNDEDGGAVAAFWLPARASLAA
jgi:C4-dicarboxylate-specific signal transduction histidine kinase/ABC-type uncharacterized transport system substrate-binding protein